MAALRERFGEVQPRAAELQRGGRPTAAERNGAKIVYALLPSSSEPYFGCAEESWCTHADRPPKPPPTAASVDGGAPAAASGIEEDPEAMWAAFEAARQEAEWLMKEDLPDNFDDDDAVADELMQCNTCLPLDDGWGIRDDGVGTPYPRNGVDRLEDASVIVQMVAASAAVLATDETRKRKVDAPLERASQDETR